MRRMTAMALATLAIGLGIAGEADAQAWDVPTFTGTSTTGTATFSSGTTAAITFPSYGNSGTPFSTPWATNAVSNDALPGGTTQDATPTAKNSLAIPTQATSSPGFVVSVTFSANVVNPVLMFNYVDFATSFDFSALNVPLVLLDSSRGGVAGNASVSNGILSVPGGNGDGDGAAIEVQGSFGPSTPLTFLSRNNVNDTVGLSIALPRAVTTITGDSPDPSTPGQTYAVSGTVAVLTTKAPAFGNLPGTVTVTVDNAAGCSDSTLAPGTISGTDSIYNFTCNITGGASEATVQLKATYADTSTPVVFQGSSDTESHQIVAPTDVYECTGFDQPVDMNGVVNTVKSGRIVPLKFFCTKNGSPITDPAEFQGVWSYMTAAEPSAAADDVETYVSKTGLLNLGDGKWQFNWATPRTAYIGQTRKVYVKWAGVKSSEAIMFFAR